MHFGPTSQMCSSALDVIRPDPPGSKRIRLDVRCPVSVLSFLETGAELLLLLLVVLVLVLVFHLTC